MNKPAMVATDNFGAVWTDERLKLPEHHTTKISGFDVEVKESAKPYQSEKQTWIWSVAQGAPYVTQAAAYAESRDDARELARFATELLSITSVEGLRDLVKNLKP